MMNCVELQIVFPIQNTIYYISTIYMDRKFHVHYNSFNIKSDLTAHLSQRAVPD